MASGRRSQTLATTQKQSEHKASGKSDAYGLERIVADIILSLIGQIIELRSVLGDCFRSQLRRIAVALPGLFGEISVFGLGRLGEVVVGVACRFLEILSLPATSRTKSSTNLGLL